jgi:hypothetical protein
LNWKVPLMLRNCLLAGAAAAVLLIQPQPAAAYDRLPQKLAALSPADFAARVRIENDAVMPSVVLSTQDGYTRGRSIKGALADDVHLRAVVDRRTGNVSWQVWHELAYVSGPRELDTIDFRVRGTAYQVRPLVVDHRLDRCPPTDAIGHCGHAMRVVFEVPDPVVREIAESYRPGERGPWQLRFRSSQGEDMVGGISPAEAAGLIQALEAWRSGRPS